MFELELELELWVDAEGSLEHETRSALALELFPVADVAAQDGTDVVEDPLAEVPLAGDRRLKIEAQAHATEAGKAHLVRSEESLEDGLIGGSIGILDAFAELDERPPLEADLRDVAIAAKKLRDGGSDQPRALLLAPRIVDELEASLSLGDVGGDALVFVFLRQGDAPGDGEIQLDRDPLVGGEARLQHAQG